jgi:hypothetical protein
MSGFKELSSLSNDDLCALWLGYEALEDNARDAANARRRGGDRDRIAAADAKLARRKERCAEVKAAWDERRGAYPYTRLRT